MASLFAARRKPKRVASTEPRDDRGVQQAQDEQDTETGPAVRRPTTAPKTKSKLRLAFDPADADADAGIDDHLPNSTQKPQKLVPSTLSKISTTRTLERRDDELPERPSYSKSYLDELKGSTPSTPKDLSQHNSPSPPALGDNDALPLVERQTQALDIASKFGTQHTLQASSIPSASEIQEKKDRRLRLAKEQQALSLGNGGSVSRNDDYVSLDAYDSDGEFKPSRLQVSTHLHNDQVANSQEYTRLIHEDEDIAEGFENFIDDEHETRQKTGRIHMGMKSDQKKDRAQIRELINDAEGVGRASGSDQDADPDADGDSDASDASDVSAEHAYMAAQTSHGVGFSNLTKEERRRADRESRRPKPPDKTTALPTLTAGLARLRELQAQAELTRQRAETRKAEIKRRLVETEGEKQRIQSGLEDLGRQLDEVGQQVSAMNGSTNANGNGHGHGHDSIEKMHVPRGLDDIARQEG